MTFYSFDNFVFFPNCLTDSRLLVVLTLLLSLREITDGYHRISRFYEVWFVSFFFFHMVASIGTTLHVLLQVFRFRLPSIFIISIIHLLLLHDCQNLWAYFKVFYFISFANDVINLAIFLVVWNEFGDWKIPAKAGFQNLEF